MTIAKQVLINQLIKERYIALGKLEKSTELEEKIIIQKRIDVINSKIEKIKADLGM